MEDYVKNYIEESIEAEADTAPILNEVYREGGWVLYETETDIECNSCPSNLISEVFPEFETDVTKDYFVGKGEEIYDGDALLRMLYDREITQ